MILDLSHSLVSMYSDVLGENFIHFVYFLSFFPEFSGRSPWFTYNDVKTVFFYSLFLYLNSIN